jgi:sepiapterin reductase
MKLFIITGASRGFGRALALEFDDPESHFHLFSRDIEKLKETKSLMKSRHVTFSSIDFSDANFEISLNKAFSELKGGLFSKVYLFNSAGSLGPLLKIRNLESKAIFEQINLNISAPIIIARDFLNHFAGKYSSTIINISSLAAIQPFDTWSLYCAGKAAREMFHQCVALENNDVRVINYAPGPLDTDMQREIRETMLDEVPLKRVFREMAEESKLVNPRDSARKLKGILEDKNGNFMRIDYYDS